MLQSKVQLRSERAARVGYQPTEKHQTSNKACCIRSYTRHARAIEAFLKDFLAGWFSRDNEPKRSGNPVSHFHARSLRSIENAIEISSAYLRFLCYVRVGQLSLFHLESDLFAECSHG